MRGVGKLDDRFDEIEERGCGPVHVFDDEEQRALVREAGEQPAGGEGGVLGLRGSLRESDGDCELVGQARGVVGPQPSAKPFGRVAVGELVQQLAKRRVRVVAAVGLAMGDDCVRHALQAIDALGREACLAQAWGAEHGDQAGTPGSDGGLD